MSATPSTLIITDEFREALQLLHDGRNLFITGKAGAGKSTLIRLFIEQTHKNVVVAAPTGIAARNVDGYTLHRLFGFLPTTTLSDVRTGHARPRALARVVKSLDTLIIDEASMVRADIFDMVITALELYGPHPGEPYGGVQVVLVGDLYQLPPVVTSEEAGHFTQRYPTPYFFSADRFSTTDFPVIELSTVFRQLGDHTLINILNEVRDGRVSKTSLDTLNSRLNEEFTPPDNELWVTLATTNRVVKNRNTAALDSLAGEEYISYATLTGDTTDFDPPTESELHFKIGAQIMLLNNDPAGRWVNGSMGFIREIYEESVLVELDTGDEVEVEPYVWEITKPALDGGEIIHEIVGAFEQLPFKLAWAITIHKSQGQTLDRAIIDLSGGTRATGQLYVALSRCRSLDGIVLTRPIFPKDVKVDHRLRTYLSENLDQPAQDFRTIECLLVGQGDGFIRPIDIAIAGQEGIITESLINPTRDVGNAATDYGLSASMLQIAPTLAQAWPALEGAIGGYGLLSTQPQALDILDTELKRTGIVTGLNTVCTITSHQSQPTPTTAAALALGAWESFHSAGAVPHIQAYNPLDDVGVGYTLTRDMEIHPWGDPAEVATLLTDKLAGLRISEQTRAVVAAFEAKYGVTVDLPEDVAQRPLGDMLAPGTRVCFTGTAVVHGREYAREDMENLATKAGLVVKSNVSRTQCDLLIAADPASQSRKARNAAQFGKPIYCAQDFITWVQAHS